MAPCSAKFVLVFLSGQTASLTKKKKLKNCQAGYALKKQTRLEVDNFDEWQKWPNEHYLHELAPSCTELLSLEVVYFISWDAYI